MGITIIGINKTNIILIAILTTYSVLSRFPLLNVFSVSLVNNLIGITKHRQFLREVSLRTNYHSKTEWIPYQRNISLLSTGQFPKVNQYFSQQSA